MTVAPLTLDQIVENGLCIGCGLCRSIAGSEQVDLVMRTQGHERPVARRALSASTLARINAVCPGTRVGGAEPDAHSETAVRDTVWGAAERLTYGYASNPEVRFRASTGGVLTALGQFLLTSGRVKFILHIGFALGSKRKSARSEVLCGV